MKNWEVKKLGDVCSFYNGQAHEKCIDENGKYKLVNSKFVSSEGENFKRTNNALSPLFVNDIVMVMSDVPNGKTLAKCFIVDKDDNYTLNQRICVIRSKNFDTRFLYYQLNRNKYLLSFDNGENQSNLRKDDILNCELLVPPLPEQQRIVAILDEAFAAIAKAKANAEQNLKNAKELFESYLQGVFENKGDGWEEKTLGEVCNFENGDRGKNYPNKSHRVEIGFPFINAGHLKDNKIDFSEMDYISEVSLNHLGNGKIKANDILFCLRGSLGKVANVGNLEKGAIASSLVILRVRKELDNDFILYFLNSNLTTKQIVNYGNGAAQPNLSAGNLKKFLIPFPKSIKEQKNIVKKLNSLSVETKRLESIYQTKIYDLEELKKSILQKAFCGEL
jgi:type I restriction enzyme S subunit